VRPRQVWGGRGRDPRRSWAHCGRTANVDVEGTSRRIIEQEDAVAALLDRLLEMRGDLGQRAGGEATGAVEHSAGFGQEIAHVFVLPG
jgi:hypothetical protein